MYRKIIKNIKSIISHKEIYNFINYYIFTAINAVISIFSISYLTKVISPEHYGMIGVYGSILYFIPALMSFSSNGLQAIEIVNLGKLEYLKFRNVFISFILLCSVLVVIMGVIMSLFTSVFGFVIIMAVMMGFVQVLSSIHNTELFQYSKPTQFGIISTGTVLFSFLLTIVFMSFFNLDWKFRIIALFVVEFIFLIIRFYLLSSIGSLFKFTYDKVQFKYFLHYGAPLMISVLAGWVLSQSDRYFLLRYFTLKEVGFYAAAAGVTSFIVMFNSNMIKVIYPLVYQKLSIKRGKVFILKITTIYSILILFVSSVFCVSLHFFGYLFLGEKFLSAMPVIYIMCFAQAFFGIYSTTGLVIDYFKMTHIKTLLVLICAVTIIVFSFIFIPNFGFYGPAVASLISYLLLSILSFFITLKLFIKHNIV